MTCSLRSLSRQSENAKRLSWEKQAQAVLKNGDVIYGRVEDIDSHAVHIEGAFGKAALPWSRLDRLVLGNQASLEKPAVLFRQLTGWHAEVQFQRYADHPYQPPDEVSAVLTSADADSVTLDHAWLGTIKIPIEQLEYLKPRFLGVSQVLTFDVLHLGNQGKPAFRVQEPIGHQYAGEFQFPPRSAHQNRSLCLRGAKRFCASTWRSWNPPVRARRRAAGFCQNSATANWAPKCRSTGTRLAG